MGAEIIIAVAIGVIIMGATVALTNYHTTNCMRDTNYHTNGCMERINQMSEERNKAYFERMESGFLKHFTALFYAQEKANKEGKGRVITTEDFKEGLEFASKVGKM